MSCDCSQFQPIELDRTSITKRIKQSPTLRKRFTAISENAELRLTLFRCPHCAQLWQSGHEWNFADQEYLFQVPPIEIEEWQRESYRQPAAMMIYSVSMQTFLPNCVSDPSGPKCRVEGCPKLVVKHSVFCPEHHIESFERVGRIPKRPVGRLFPPYFIRTPPAA
jgi:hypothetical protein